MPIFRCHPCELSSGVAKILKNASRQSSCRRRQVGAAVFDASGNLISVGWNNEQPIGLSCLEGDCPRGMAPYDVIPADSPYNDCIAQHAEIMALQKAELLTATDGPLDLQMFVTHKPCHECTEFLNRLDMFVLYLEEL